MQHMTYDHGKSLGNTPFARRSPTGYHPADCRLTAEVPKIRRVPEAPHSPHHPRNRGLFKPKAAWGIQTRCNAPRPERYIK